MIQMECISANPSNSGKSTFLKNFNSYVFDRNILTPASAFRFTAPDVSKDSKLAIRSGDTIRLFVDNDLGHRAIVGVGFIDETDTHITPSQVEYVVTGRDTVGQLVDNDSADANNQLITFKQATINTVVSQLLQNTRMIQSHRASQLDSTLPLAVSTNFGETKIATLQRYLEFLGGLAWADNDGSLIVDKPNFTQAVAGSLALRSSTSAGNNVLEARVRRNINQAIRSIVTCLDGTQVAKGSYETLHNMDRGIAPYKNTKVGRSVSRLFSYAQGTDSINQLRGTGRGSANTHTLAREYSAREIARENMKILDVECVVEGHFNKVGYLYNIDQVYQVDIEEENVSEPMYVYGVSYELTLDHGMMTRLHLCRLWTICAYADQLQRVVT